MKLISFRITGAFSAFRDPSVTSNQIVYHIPSKSAVVGLLGAMIGINRSNQLDEIYGKEYTEFFRNIKIGIQFESEPKKVMFFTNHHTFKKPSKNVPLTIKPFKTELIENPIYTIYVSTDDDNYKKLVDALQKNEFVYSPYLGHVYCLASVSCLKQIDVHEIDSKEEKKTRCVILDESETYDPDFKLKLRQISGDASIIIERHTHHFFNDGKFDGRVLKHWIPIENSEFKITSDSKRSLSKFYKMGDHVVCMY